MSQTNIMDPNTKGDQTKRDWIRLLRVKAPEYIHQFSEMTTLHGVRYLGEKNRSLLERVFWGLALAVTYSSCWYFVSQVSSDWRTSPVVMSVETHATASWTIPAPAVTVCASSHISHAKINYTALCDAKNLSSSMKARLEVVHQLCAYIGGDADYLDDDAIKFVIDNYLPDLRRVFVSVTRIEKSLQPLSDHIQVVLTPISICFVHNMLPLDAILRPEYLSVYEHYGLFSETTALRSRKSWTPDLGYLTDEPDVTPIRLWGHGFRSSTKYLLSINDLDYDPTCSFDSKALSIYLHNPAELPWRIHSNVYLPTNYRVAAFISPIVTTTDDEVKVWNPTKRGCYFENERYLRYFRFYTQRNCERECDSNNTFRHCGCVLLSQPRNMSMPVCGNGKNQCVDQSQKDIIEQEIRHRNTYACKCLPSCNSIDFETETHWRPWHFKVNSTFAAVPATIDLNSTSISLIAIAVKKKYLNKTKRTALIGSAAYVANIGGILSLFLGISFLSLFEVLYFITLRVLINIWNMKRRECKAHQQHVLVNSNLNKQPFIP